MNQPTESEFLDDVGLKKPDRSPPPPLANKTADMTSNNVNNKAEYLKYLFIVIFNKNKIKASKCNLKSAE